MTRSFNLETLRQDLRAHFLFVKAFVRKPIQSIQSESAWDYQRSAVFLVVASIISAFVSGVLHGSIAHAVAYVLVLPCISVALALIITVLLVQIIRFVHERQLDSEPVFQIVAMSFLPFLFFRMFRGYAPPVTLIGTAATCALLIVGLTDRFQLPRRSVVKIISIFFVLYFVIWGVEIVRKASFNRGKNPAISDESLKVLDQEFKQ